MNNPALLGFCHTVSVLFGLALLSCSTADRPGGVSGETHWLAACSATGECARGDCVCGLCTEPCTGDALCSGDIEALCYDVKSPGLVDHCDEAIRERGGAICIAVCKEDAECPAGDACRAGACAPRVATGRPASSTAIDFLGVDAGLIDFSTPVQPPQPSVPLQGDAEKLLGTWVEQFVQSGNPRRTMIIERNEAGRIVGHVSRAPMSDWGETLPPPQLPSVLDADHPPQLSNTYTSSIINGVSEYPYRLFDGQLNGTQFSGWFSYYDVWNDWCVLQTPYRVDVYGETRYVCTPDMFDTGVDIGKRALCTSADMSGCAPGRRLIEGEPVSCSDVMPETELCRRESTCVCMQSDNLDLCKPSICTCDAKQCRADVWQNAQWWNLTLAGDSLTGYALGPVASLYLSITLKKVSP